jgi:putative transposase
MARLPRLNLVDTPQHVIQRGNNRSACFFSTTDYQLYLDKLLQYSIQFNVAVHAYVLMTNHVHLLLTPATKEGVSKLMQSLGRYYVQYINRTYRRTGTLWEGRYKSTLVDSSYYFLTVSRYIEMNPVRANMVIQPNEYPWSSFHANALGKGSSLISSHECYRQLGKNACQQRQAYLALFEQPITAEVAKTIRHSTNKGWVLGSDRFQSEVQTMLSRKVTPAQRGGDRRSKKFKSNYTKKQVF